MQERNVENYPLPSNFYLKGDDRESSEEEEANMTNRSYTTEQRLTNKRTFQDRKNVHLRLGKRGNVQSQGDNRRGSMRVIKDLECDVVNSTEEEIASDIADKLDESKDTLIRKLFILFFLFTKNC